jgi:hypothetical protein
MPGEAELVGPARRAPDAGPPRGRISSGPAREIETARSRFLLADALVEQSDVEVPVRDEDTTSE